MTVTGHRLVRDADLRQRAAQVIPGGMYGHMSMGPMPDGYPQFMKSGEGARLWDPDGNEYIDFMCGWGPVVLGRRHPRVEAAVARQLAEGDCLNGPSAVMVDLAELIVDTVPHADWALLAKNGTDATTICVTIARAATGRRKVLAAHGAYHGAAPWCTPRPAGVLPSDRAHLAYFDYNDVESLRVAVAEAGSDLAAIIVCPVRQDNFRDQELADPAFAREVRALCDAAGAVMIVDDVRCGFRLDMGGSWEPLGVRPDLAAWSKAIANGYALAAVTGTDALRDAATTMFTTGSFWFSAVSMAAAV
ncbi:MAG: aminotransferase class-III, partial [Dactylosporangium sp.]|nr:aminotransferase class-III [Dactylosporangium sp.]